MNKRNYQLLLCESRLESDTKQQYSLGDVNGDGRITRDDAELILQYVAGTPLVDLYNRTDITLGQFKNICDVNGDGRIDAKDARLILQIANGIESEKTTTFSHLIFSPVLELGSSTSDSTGQAFNIEFYSKIDGTHELTFELPQFYFDENTGENIDNPLVKHVGNKCQLELHIDGKTYFMVVNSRTDSEEGMGPISYKYECTDAFIEELSKSGYGITFSDDVEGNGLGTIHDFSQQVAQGTEWVYDREKTGTLLEYERGMTWDIVNAQYKETRTPKPVHKVKYIPELKRYCNELKYFKKKDGDNTIARSFSYLGDVDGDGYISKDDVENILNHVNGSIKLSGEQLLRADVNHDGKITAVDARILLQIALKEGKDTNSSWSIQITPELAEKYGLIMAGQEFKINSPSEGDATYHRIYSYEDSEQVTSNTVQNYLYNGDDFIDLVGWNTYTLSGDPTDTSNSIGYGPTLTSVLPDGSDKYDLKVDTSGTWYLINETTQGTNKSIKGGEPYVFKWTGAGKINGLYIYSADPRTNPDKLIYSANPLTEFESGDYYVIKTQNYISSPYIVLKIQGNLIADSFEFFPVKGKDGDGDENYLLLLSQLTDGTEINPREDKDILDIMQLPADTISSYTHKSIKYFIRDNYEVDTLGVETQIIKDSEKDTITYVEIADEDENKIRLIGCHILDSGDFKDIDSEIYLEKVNNLDFKGDPDRIYKLNSDGKFHQYYTVDDGHGNTGGDWDYAFYDTGNNDKRRTLNISKSNRFNIIQELAELFRVWPVFEMYRDSNGETVKKFWYRENCIKENFSGFHKGVNIESLSRTIDSNNIVTKMYVEDQDNEYVEDGFVTIRTSPLNPWGENYYYNFQYYVNQRLLDRASIEEDLKELYKEVKGINYSIREINDKIINAKPDLVDLGARLKSLTLSIAACNERITSLNADIVNYEGWGVEPPKEGEETNTLPDYQVSAKDVRRQLQQKAKFEDEMKTVKEKYDKLEKEIQNWQQEVKDLQLGKTTLIHEFENKYSQFIKEGVWADSSYIDNTQYYLDSLDVMNTSSMPQVEWNISVIDGSLIDGLKDFQFTVGDQTILVDNEFFMKEPNENYQFKVLITGTREFLDNPISNVIEVRNFFTSFEDIFQRVAAATQTLELKEQTYNKAEYFTQDGQIDQSILQNSMLNNALILANSTDNSYVLDNTGLHLQSVLNPAKQLRAIADGIFITNSKDPITGESKWMTGITADGINASVLTAGQINTSVVRIYTDGMPAFSWNNLGITAYKFIENGTKVDSNSFFRLDSFGLYSVDGVDSSIYFNYDGAGNAWYKGVSYTDEDGKVISGRDAAIQQILNHSTFSLTDKGFRLNISNPWTQGTATYRPYIYLGYAKDDPVTKMWAPLFGEPPEDLFGLYISDRSGLGHMVKLQSNGEDNLIAGWTINSNSLVNEQGGRDADGLFYEDCRIYAMKVPDSNLATETVLSIGKITKSGYRDMDNLSKGKYSTDEEWASTNFYVTADGTLHANALILGGSASTEDSYNGSLMLTNQITQQPINVYEDREGKEIHLKPGESVPAGAIWLYTYEETTVEKKDGSGDITYKTKDNGGYVTIEQSFGTQSDDGSTSYFNLSKKGLLQADNAIIKGMIVAGSGSIGGWEINNEILCKSGFWSSKHDDWVENQSTPGVFYEQEYDGYNFRVFMQPPTSDGKNRVFGIGVHSADKGKDYDPNHETLFFPFSVNAKGVLTLQGQYSLKRETSGTLIKHISMKTEIGSDIVNASSYVFRVYKKTEILDASTHKFKTPETEDMFYVKANGDVYAKGEIYATSGEIGGCKIVDGKLTIPEIEVGTISADKITAGTCSATVKFSSMIAQKGCYLGSWKVVKKTIPNYSSYEALFNSTTLSLDSSIYETYLSPYGVEVQVTPLVGDTDIYSNTWIRIITGKASAASDERLKHNIHCLDNRHEIFFDKIQPKTFNYLKEAKQGNTEKIHFGFIAQEIMKAEEITGLINLDLVNKEVNGYYTLNYRHFIALNTWQIQKAKARISTLEQRVENIERTLNLDNQTLI